MAAQERDIQPSDTPHIVSATSQEAIAEEQAYALVYGSEVVRGILTGNQDLTAEDVVVGLRVAVTSLAPFIPEGRVMHPFGSDSFFRFGKVEVAGDDSTQTWFERFTDGVTDDSEITVFHEKYGEPLQTYLLTKQEGEIVSQAPYNPDPKENRQNLADAYHTQLDVISEHGLSLPKSEPSRPPRNRSIIFPPEFESAENSA